MIGRDILRALHVTNVIGWNFFSALMYEFKKLITNQNTLYSNWKASGLDLRMRTTRFWITCEISRRRTLAKKQTFDQNLRKFVHAKINKLKDIHSFLPTSSLECNSLNRKRSYSRIVQPKNLDNEGSFFRKEFVNICRVICSKTIFSIIAETYLIVLSRLVK